MQPTHQITWYPSLKPISRTRASIHHLIDLGSSQIICTTIKLKPKHERGLHPLITHDIQVLGIGTQQAEGIKAGHVSDIKAARYAIQSAVSNAEKQSKLTVDKAILITNAGKLSSEAFSAHHKLNHYQINQQDIDQLANAGRRFSVAPNRIALHAHAIGYVIDDGLKVNTPLGMVGEHLDMNMHITTADDSAIRNLIYAAESGYMRVQTVIAAPFACGLTVLNAEDHEHGALVIDAGSDLTGYAIFRAGRMEHIGTIPIGGSAITQSIAREFNIDHDNAERLKVLYGHAYSSPHERDELITLPDTKGAQNEIGIYRSELNNVIERAIKPMFENLRQNLQTAGFPLGTPARAVVTGAASQLQGFSAHCERVLHCTVREGSLNEVGQFSAEQNPHLYSAIAGSAIYLQQSWEDFVLHPLQQKEKNTPLENENTFSKIGRWLADNF